MVATRAGDPRSRVDPSPRRSCEFPRSRQSHHQFATICTAKHVAELARRLFDPVEHLLAGPLLGILLGIYAWGVWNLKRVALPIAYVYAAYVSANLFLYPRFQSVPDGPGGTLTYVLYGAVAVGASVGCAILLTRRKAELT